MDKRGVRCECDERSGWGFFSGCVRWSLAEVAACSTQPVVHAKVSEWPPNEPADMVLICFILEESYWLFCDTGGAKLAHIGYKKWMAEARLVFGIEPDFWKGVLSYFSRFKSRMPVASALLISSDSKQCVLVRSVNQKNRWVLPGGKCFDKLESNERCMGREMREEISVHAEDVEWVSCLPTRDGRRLFNLHILRMKPNVDHTICIDRRELVDARWFFVDDVTVPKGTEINSMVFRAFEVLKTIIK